jgi:sugar (pentulose or hexulose) kinase
MGSDKPSAVVVFDVGKTHVKLLAIEPGGGVIASEQTANAPIDGPPYLHVDVEAIFSWLSQALADFLGRFSIEAIVPSAYGSTAALIDDDDLVLPMMDYEAEPPSDIAEAYAKLAPQFEEVCCPINPGGLTLARQLYWQSRHFKEAFAKARWILPAAQYWGWRLTGNVASEMTSLGAQTQLWNPRMNQPSSLALREGVSDKLPPLMKAFDTLGPLAETLIPDLGLNASPAPPVLVGIHDSNANYARYLSAKLDRFTLISSGTWLISFDSDLPLDQLDPNRDMVSNTDIEGRSVACTRFMGGREFFELAGEDGLKTVPGPEDLAKLISQGTMALPSFTDSGGPFPGTGDRGRIIGPMPEGPKERAALATLYVALMTAVDLDLLGSRGQVIIDGSFAENRLYAGLLGTLRPEQPISVSKAKDGTALGAALLWGWPKTAPLDLETVPPVVGLEGLSVYAESWLRSASA